MIGGVAVGAGDDERRDAVAVRRLDVGFRGQEQLDRLHVVALDGPVQRRGAVRYRRR